MLSLQVHPLIPGYLAELSGSPEKAGVGGSIPSSAAARIVPLTCSRKYHPIETGVLS
jgi:hypothetical protein